METPWWSTWWMTTPSSFCPHDLGRLRAGRWTTTTLYRRCCWSHGHTQNQGQLSGRHGLGPHGPGAVGRPTPGHARGCRIRIPLGGSDESSRPGSIATRSAKLTLTLAHESIAITVFLPDRSARGMTDIPSLLGRDYLSRFAQFLDQRTGSIPLLEPAEADALTLPAGSR